jgi:hypothetical protein
MNKYETSITISLVDLNILKSLSLLLDDISVSKDNITFIAKTQATSRHSAIKFITQHLRQIPEINIISVD